MKLKTLVYFAVALISYSCVNHRKSGNNEQIQSDTITMITDKPSPFSPMIEEAIGELIKYTENRERTSESKLVYGLMFYKENNNEFIGTFTEPFYVKNQIIGYTYFKDQIITYNGDTIIGSKYIDINKLELFNDTLPGFLDYDDMPPAIYEPFGILFQIISPDSLLMIHKGML